MERLQFITHQTENNNCFQSAEFALKGGVRWIQFRMKNAEIPVQEKEALQIKKLCEDYRSVFIINDSPMLALQVDADGVHLGKTDMNPLEARKLLGSNKIIGGTANTFEDIKRLYNSGVDYIGLGPFRYTQTKQNLSPVLGLEGYADIMDKCSGSGIRIPVFAIGGITGEDILPLSQTGIFGMALSSVIGNAADPEKEANKLKKIVDDCYSTEV